MDRGARRGAGVPYGGKGELEARGWRRVDEGRVYAPEGRRALSIRDEALHDTPEEVPLGEQGGPQPLLLQPVLVHRGGVQGDTSVPDFFKRD